MNVPFQVTSPITGMSLEIDLLRTFVAIVDTGSFKAASEMVFRTPSAISMQVKKLEEIIGRPVFLRDARAVRLTPDGDILLSYARRILSISDEALSHFRAPEVQGIVRLGAPDDYGSRFLPTILKRFATTHPGVVVDVVIDFSVNLKERVKKGELDLALFSCTPDATSDERTEIVLEEEVVWAGIKGGCSYLKTPLPISIWEEGCAWRTNAIDALNKAGRDYRVAYMSGHTAGQKAAIEADLAVAPFPRSMIQAPFVQLTEKDGLPPLGTYKIGIVRGPKPDCAANAVSEHIKQAFEDFRAEA